MLRYSVVLALGAGSVHAAPLVDLKAGDLQFTFSGARAAVLKVRGVEVFRESGLYIVTPGWTKAMLNTDMMTPVVTVSEDGDAKVATLEYSPKDAHAVFRYELRPDNTFKVSLTYSTTVQPAWVEFDAAYINANIISARPFTAETIDGPRSGRVAAFTNIADQVKNRVCPFFSSATFDSRIGPMTISVKGNTRETSMLNIFDARGITLDWGAKNPMFWLGLGSPERAVLSGDNTISVTWMFGTAQERGPVAPPSVKIIDVQNAVQPEPELPIIPQPKQMMVGEGKLRINKKTRIRVEKRPSPEALQGAKELQAVFREQWGTDIPILASNDAVGGKTDIYLMYTMKTVDFDWADHKWPPVRNPEGYYLKASSEGIAVLGADDIGAYYGIQTLKQLIRRDEKGVYIKPVTIRDWPTMEFRGLHWFGGPESWPFHQRMIDRIAAPVKINKMVYEVEYSQWASQPKIWNPTRSTPLDQVRKTVAEARAHFIEPIPLIPTLGHTDWLFQNGQNLAFSADRKSGHAYDPTLEESYNAVFGVMQEAIDIFQPKWFHIGHDEVTTFGEHLPPAKVTEYFVTDVQKIHGWLKAKGIGTMVWGDELLHSSETLSSGNAYTLEDAKTRRAGMPKDVVIADWHYRGDAEYPSVEIFQKDGHKVIGCTWSQPMNIRNFSKSLADQKAWGLLQTTWDGYGMRLDRVTGDSLKQYAAYVLAAEYAWNGGEPALGKLGYNPMDAFLKFWERNVDARTPRPGFKVSIGGILSGVRNERSRRTVPEFRVPLAGKLAGTENPASLEIPLNNRVATSLRFVWGTDFSVPVGTTVATLSAQYADGTTASVPIAYGRQIAAFNDLRTRPDTTGVWTGQSAAGELRERRAWTWPNPNPSKPIRSITITSANTEAAPVLLEISGIR